MYWIEVYGGGVFVPSRRPVRQAYGAGRSLLDTIEGPDLGGDGDRLILVLDLRLQPVLRLRPRWSCPLAPAADSLQVPIRACERYTTHE